MGLFLDQEVTAVVKPNDIRDLTGIQSTDFQFKEGDKPDEALDAMLKTWIDRIASHIHSRLNRRVSKDDDDYLAIQDILIRTVAKVVGVAQQQRTSPVIQINEFAVSILNTSEVTNDLKKELKPFRKVGFSFFSSSEDYKEDE